MSERRPRGGTRRETRARRTPAASGPRASRRGSWMWSWTVCGETTSVSASSALLSPRASRVATSRSRAVTPFTSRRSVADCAPVARSSTTATRPVLGPSGSEACRVIQPIGLGSVTWLLRGAAWWRSPRTNEASPSTATGGVVSEPLPASLRMAASSSYAGGVTSSTTLLPSRTISRAPRHVPRVGRRRSAATRGWRARSR